METLPLELHSQIIQAACLDNGITALSLSLVSRYMRDVTRPFLYQSISVSGLDSLSALARKLEILPPHMRRIRRLFLSDWTSTSAKLNTIPSDDTAMGRYAREEATIIRIIEHAAPTLETLNFTIFCPWNGTPLIGHLFSTTFPYLKELFAHGFYPFPQVSLTMPRLRRLHLSGNRNPHGLFQTGDLNAACPSLTDLTISGLSSAVSFATELRSAILSITSNAGEDDQHPESGNAPLSPFPVVFPSNLQSLTVRYFPCMTKSKHAQNTHEKMRTLLDIAESGALRYEATEGQQGDIFDTFRQEWTDGVRRGNVLT